MQHFKEDVDPFLIPDFYFKEPDDEDVGFDSLPAQEYYPQPQEYRDPEAMFQEAKHRLLTLALTLLLPVTLALLVVFKVIHF